jgi:hypothetical protein
VTANDILGQRGPVVTGPPLAPAPAALGDPSNPLGFEAMPSPNAAALIDQMQRGRVGMDRPTFVDRDFAPTTAPVIPPLNLTGQDRPTYPAFQSSVASGVPVYDPYSEYLKAGIPPGSNQDGD